MEGLNNKLKLTLRKAYGYRSLKVAEIACYHTLGRLPEPEFAHRFFRRTVIPCSIFDIQKIPSVKLTNTRLLYVMRSSTRRTVALIVIAILLLAVLGGAGYLYQGGFFADLFESWITLGVLVLALLSVPVGLYVAMRRHTHKGYLVVWCRRFGHWNKADGRRNSWLRDIIVHASSGFALPVTLSDKSVTTAKSISDHLEPPLVLLLMVLIYAAMIWLVFQIPDGTIDNLLGFVVIMAILGAGWTLIILATNWFMTSFATYRNDAENLRQRVRGIAERKYYRGDSFVVRCTDDDWQECVDAVLHESSFAILDITSTTVNVAWEIQRCLDSPGPDRVLFIEEVPHLETPSLTLDDLPEERSGVTTAPRIFLRYSARWADEERTVYLRRDDDHKDRELGPLALALSGSIRQWMEGAARSLP